MVNNLNVAEWIIVGILSTTLFILLILCIILTVKLIKLTNQVRRIAETGQNIADSAASAVENVRDMTATGSMAKNIFLDFIARKFAGDDKKKKR